MKLTGAAVIALLAAPVATLAQGAAPADSPSSPPVEAAAVPQRDIMDLLHALTGQALGPPQTGSSQGE